MPAVSVVAKGEAKGGFEEHVSQCTCLVSNYAVGDWIPVFTGMTERAGNDEIGIRRRTS